MLVATADMPGMPTLSCKAGRQGDRLQGAPSAAERCKHARQSAVNMVHHRFPETMKPLKADGVPCNLSGNLWCTMFKPNLAEESAHCRWAHCVGSVVAVADTHGAHAED